MPDERPRLTRVAGRAAWHIYHARRRVSTGCADRTAAEAVLAQYVAELGRPQTPIVSVAEILDAYLANRRQRGIPGADRLGWAHKPLARRLGHKAASTIGEADAHAYATQRGKEVAPATVRTELQALRAALRWAASERLITEAPRIPMPPRPEGRIRWLTREEADKLIAGCRAPHVRLFVTIALHTAARSSAILSLTWDRVDLDRRLLDFREPGRAATRKRRVPVPINDTLATALREAQAAATCEYVVEWAGDRIDRIKHGFHDAAARAELAGVTPHVLRHTAVTWMLQAGVDPWEVAGLAGMTVEMVQATYGHHHPEHLRRAARALG